MARYLMRGYDVEHPEPHLGAVSLPVLFLALLGPPLAWVVQLYVGYALTENACFPRATPLAAGLEFSRAVWPGALALNLGTLVFACACIVLSFRILQRTRNGEPATYTGLVEAGPGRTRYLAVWGIWIGAWFAIDILFSTVGMLGITSCG